MKNYVTSKDVNKELIDAVRLNDVLQTIADLEKEELSVHSDLPVDPYIDDDGETKWRIDCKLVLEELSDFVQLILGKVNEYRSYNNYFNLNQYISTQVNRCLHNYANSLSHRKTVEQMELSGDKEYDMEYIRTLQIIGYITSTLNINIEDGQSSDSLDIPNGWKSSYVRISVKVTNNKHI